MVKSLRMYICSIHLYIAEEFMLLKNQKMLLLLCFKNIIKCNKNVINCMNLYYLYRLALRNLSQWIRHWNRSVKQRSIFNLFPCSNGGQPSRSRTEVWGLLQASSQPHSSIIFKHHAGDRLILLSPDTQQSHFFSKEEEAESEER